MMLTMAIRTKVIMLSLRITAADDDSMSLSLSCCCWLVCILCVHFSHGVLMVVTIMPGRRAYFNWLDQARKLVFLLEVFAFFQVLLSSTVVNHGCRVIAKEESIITGSHLLDRTTDKFVEPELHVILFKVTKHWRVD